MNLSNKITIVRILLVPLFVLSVLYSNIFSTLSLLFLIFLSDILDGYFARKRDEVTKLGQILDPVADKFFAVSALLALFYRYNLPLLYLPLLLIREIGFLIILPVMFSKKARKRINYSSAWPGKLTTFVQGTVIFLLVLGYKSIIPFVLLTATIAVISLVFYIRRGIKRI